MIDLADLKACVLVVELCDDEDAETLETIRIGLCELQCKPLPALTAMNAGILVQHRAFWEGSILFDAKSSCHLTVDPMKDSDEFGIDSYIYTYIETLEFVNNVVSI